MPRYTQLSSEERRLLSRLIQLGQSLRSASKVLGRSPSTLSRETRRNLYAEGELYNPQVAHKKARLRRKHRAYVSKFSPSVIYWIERKLTGFQWSPAQISGRLLAETGKSVSHEWIYQWVLKDRRSGGNLFRHLRRSHRKNRKRYGIARKSTKYEEAKSIDVRPEIVNKRARVGDWEGDLVLGGTRQGAILSLVERATCFTKLTLLKSKEAHLSRDAIIHSFKKLNGPKYTLTLDRGSEFCDYKFIEKRSGVEVCFAHPYSSFERGTNENLNGLIRQYFPKKFDLTKIHKTSVKFVEWVLNNRPRKKLGYLTPFEAYYGYCPYPRHCDRPHVLAA